MIIYKDYTTDNVIMGEPYYLESLGYIHPIEVKNYNKFKNYVKYILLNNKHLGVELNSDISLLGSILLFMIESNKNENIMESLTKCIEDLEQLFTLTSKSEIKLKTDNDYKGIYNLSDLLEFVNNLVFIDDKFEVVIDNNNFNIYRTIVLKQNGLVEPIIYEDSKTAEWMEKARIAKMKESERNNPSLEIGEMLTVVSCATGKSYKELINQNMLQLYSDYLRINHVANYNKLVLYKTVSEKISDPTYNTPIIRKIFENTDENSKIDSEAFSIF